eukprot:gb/GECG01003339.1/.p1 GENE.gb/GECG01003339.1/~~gb/GECG01003339.1/.p1  ORF type:complete len:494 (+),score=76.96 gb/GECG01003339.1/:1-1482(+)
MKTVTQIINLALLLCATFFGTSVEAAPVSGLQTASTEAKSKVVGEFEMKLDGNEMQLLEASTGNDIATVKFDKAGPTDGEIEIGSDVKTSIDSDSAAFDASMNLGAAFTVSPLPGSLEAEANFRKENGFVENPHGSLSLYASKGSIKWSLRAKNWDIGMGKRFQVQFEVETDASLQVSSMIQNGITVKVLNIGGNASIVLPLEAEIDGELSKDVEITVDTDTGVVTCSFPHFENSLKYDPVTRKNSDSSTDVVSSGDFEMKMDGNSVELVNQAKGKAIASMEVTEAGRQSSKLSLSSETTVEIQTAGTLTLLAEVDLAASITSTTTHGGLKLRAELVQEEGTYSSTYSNIDWNVRPGTVKWSFEVDDGESWYPDGGGEDFEIDIQLNQGVDIDVSERTEQGVTVKVLSLGGEASVLIPLEVEIDGEMSQDVSVEVNSNNVLRCIFPAFSSTLNYDPTTESSNASLPVLSTNQPALLILLLFMVYLLSFGRKDE